MTTSKSHKTKTIDQLEAFNLGWDFGKFGGSNKYFNTANGRLRSVLDGYNYFLSSNKPRVYFDPHDHHFVMRWLRLRLNAMNRGRVVDKNVTWQYLKSISTDFCPVTMKKFTSGDKCPTNKTLDRINNNAGYAVGNIMFVSRIVNESKDRKDFLECWKSMEKASENANDCFDGLKSFEWARLTSICSINSEDESITPALIPIFLELPFQPYPMSPWKRIQSMSYTVFFDYQPKAGQKYPLKKDWLKAFKGLNNHNLMKKATKFADFASRTFASLSNRNKTVSQVYFASWTNVAVFKAWKNLCQSLSPQQANIVDHELKKIFHLHLNSKEYINKHWALKTHGFLVEENKISTI